MEAASSDSERLLDSRPDSFSIDGNKETLDYSRNRIYSSARAKSYRFVSISLALILLFTNFGWYWAYRERVQPVRAATSKAVEAVEPHYYLEEHDVPKMYLPISHDWEDLREGEVVGQYRYADEHWDHWVPRSGGAVAVSRDFQIMHGLDLGATATRDNSSNYHYIVAGYHQIHCLSVVRDVIYQLNGTLPNQDPILWDHILHCVEAVRQALQCFLDPTLIPLDRPWPGLPNGQMHVCRNSDALLRWTNQNHHDLPEYVESHNTPHTAEWLAKHEELKALKQGRD